MAIAALRRLCVPFLVVAVTIALLALSSGDSKAQWVKDSPQFQPVYDFKLCNDLPDTFSGPAVLKGPVGVCAPATGTAGSVRDITTDFTVPLGHLAYDQSSFLTAGGASETRLAGPVGGVGSNATYDPTNIEDPGPFQGPCNDGLDNQGVDDPIPPLGDGADAADTDCAEGTGLPAGGLISNIRLGLANNPCNTSISPAFIWWDSETNLADTVACQPEGTNNRWENLANDGTGGDIYPGQADPTSLIVTKFPDCIKKVFDPDGSGDATGGASPVQPNWRGAGLTQVPPGGNWQMLNNIEFAPGALKAAFSAYAGTTNHPYAKLDASLGYVNLILLNDPTTVVLEPNPISDFCSSLGTQGMIKGQVGAVNRITQPGTPGSYMAQARTMSYRDADGDGIENNFDTCAWTSNTDNPWLTAGVDIDMLDPVCDPDPLNPAAQFDEDGDTYSNSQDWCPQVSNPPVPGVTGETDAESAQPYNTANPDGGPPQDSIGDDCDGTASPENPGGLGTTTVSDGLYFNAIHVDSVTITGSTVDADGDGWGSDLETPAEDANANYPGQMTHVKVDLAGAPTLDSDGDGTYNVIEWAFIGTDPAYKCAKFPGKHDAWPADFDMNRIINLGDVFPVLPPTFGKSAGQVGFSARADLVPDGIINLGDVFPVLPPTFGQSCTPPS